MAETDEMNDNAPPPEEPAQDALPAPGAEATAATGAPGDGDAEHPPDAQAEEIPDEVPVLPASDIRAIVEALVFASPHPVTPREIRQVLTGVDEDAWRAAMEELKLEYAREGRGLQLVEVASGFQITTRPEYNDWVRELLNPKAPSRLSIQALETLAVIAYKQPVTLPEIIELRGVKSGGVIKTLLEKHLIRIVGRKEVVGRPMLYDTTKDFLLHFGLKDLTDLPKIEEFAEVLGEEVDVAGLKKAIEAPRPVEVPLSEEEAGDTARLPFDAPPETNDDTESATAFDSSSEPQAGDDDSNEPDPIKRA